MLTAQQIYDQIIANGWGGFTLPTIYGLWYYTYNHVPPPPNSLVTNCTALYTAVSTGSPPTDLCHLIATYY